MDANGDQLSLYEFLQPSLFGLVRKSRYQLCTGEPVMREGDGFVVVSTGEHLRKVRDVRDR